MRHFVGIGAAKAGSSWLHVQLALHPQVGVPPRKELHYFDRVAPGRLKASYESLYVNRIRAQAAQISTRPQRAATEIALLCDLLDLSAKSPAGYRAYLDSFADGEALIAGETTPDYSTLGDEGMALLRDTLDPLLIFVMRDPLERDWSEVRMRVKDEAAWLRAFEANHPGRAARGDYQATIETVERHFNPDRVLYLFYEDLIADATLRKVARFLGVDEVWPWDLGRQTNVGRSASMPEPPPQVVDRLAPVYDFVHKRFGEDVPDAWRY